MQYIAQSPTPQQPIQLPQDPLAQYGIVGVLVVVFLNQGIPLIKDSIKWLQNKEENDDKLTQSLIQDLRTDNKSILQTVATTLNDIKDIQSNGNTALGKLTKATDELHNVSQNEQSTLAALVVEMRSLRDETVRVSDKVAALHTRLDRLIIEKVTERPE